MFQHLDCMITYRIVFVFVCVLVCVCLRVSLHSLDKINCCDLVLLVSFLFIKFEGHTIDECCQEANDGYLTATLVQFFDGLFHRLGGNGKTKWLRATCHVCKNVEVTWPNCQTKIKPYKMTDNKHPLQEVDSNYAVKNRPFGRPWVLPPVEDLQTQVNLALRDCCSAVSNVSFPQLKTEDLKQWVHHKKCEYKTQQKKPAKKHKYPAIYNLLYIEQIPVLH